MKYILNTIKKKDFGEDILITTDQGSWVFIKKKEYLPLIRKEIKEDKKLEALEKYGIILTENNIDNVSLDLRKKYTHLMVKVSSHIIFFNQSNKEESKQKSSIKKLDESMITDIINFIFSTPSKNIAIECKQINLKSDFSMLKLFIEKVKVTNLEHNKVIKFILEGDLCEMDKEKIDFLKKEEISLWSLVNSNIDSNLFKKKTETEKKIIVPVTKKMILGEGEVIDKLINLNIEEIDLRFINDGGYSVEEFIKFWKRFMDELFLFNKKGNSLLELSSWIIIAKIIKIYIPEYIDLRDSCGAGIGQIVYTPNGDLYSCENGPKINGGLFKLGSIKKEGYNEILSSKKSIHIISTALTENKPYDYYIWSPYFKICPVCTYFDQGSILSKITESNQYKICDAKLTYIFEKILKKDYAIKHCLKWLKKEFI